MSYYGPEDYEGYAPSDELSLQIHELITNEAKSKIAGTFEELERANKSIETIRQQNRELRDKVSGFDKELEMAKKEAVKETKRSFFDGYICGDKVFVANAKYGSRSCVTCTGKSKITTTFHEKELEVQCPDCKGYGKITFYTYEPLEDSIGTICVELNDRGGKFVSAWLKKKDSKVEHEKLFRTLEECQAYCEEKNKPKEEVEC